MCLAKRRRRRRTGIFSSFLTNVTLTKNEPEKTNINKKPTNRRARWGEGTSLVQKLSDDKGSDRRTAHICRRNPKNKKNVKQREAPNLASKIWTTITLCLYYEWLFFSLQRVCDMRWCICSTSPRARVHTLTLARRHEIRSVKVPIGRHCGARARVCVCTVAGGRWSCLRVRASCARG